MDILLDLMHRQFIRILAVAQNENDGFYEQNFIYSSNLDPKYN